MTDQVMKLKTALKTISDYTKLKPDTLAQALHMVTLIEVIATETLKEVETTPP